MTLKQETQAPSYTPSYPMYTPEMLATFGKWLNMFSKKKRINYPQPAEIDLIDIDAAMIAFGATSKTGAVIVDVLETDMYGNVVRHQQPTKFDLFWHKYNAWQKTLPIGKGFTGGELGEAAVAVGVKMAAEPTKEENGEPGEPPKVVKRPYTLKRSALNEYRENYGKEFSIPPNSIVIEDVVEKVEEVAEPVVEKDVVVNNACAHGVVEMGKCTACGTLIEDSW